MQADKVDLCVQGMCPVGLSTFDFLGLGPIEKTAKRTNNTQLVIIAVSSAFGIIVLVFSSWKLLKFLKRRNEVLIDEAINKDVESESNLDQTSSVKLQQNIASEPKSPEKESSHNSIVDNDSNLNSRRKKALQGKFDDVNIFNISNKANYVVMGSTGQSQGIVENSNDEEDKYSKEQTFANLTAQELLVTI